MSGKIVVVASGETERRVLPILLAHLVNDGVEWLDVRVPPGHRDVTPQLAEQVIRATYWELHGKGCPPDKFVVLKDTDAGHPDDVMAPFAQLEQRLRLDVPIRIAVAQRHLEAWFFADPAGLRGFLGRELGSIDVDPDAITNPKLHLINLLSNIYSSRVAETIAREVDPLQIRSNSASFRGFIQAAMNGNS